jgi:hypothetical protein
MGDTIHGSDGQDVIFGDFGLYDAQIEFLPFQNYRPIIDFSDSAGHDTIDGGANDDFIIGQEVSQRVTFISGCSAVSHTHAYLLREMTSLTVVAEAMTSTEAIQCDLVWMGVIR